MENMNSENEYRADEDINFTTASNKSSPVAHGDNVLQNVARKPLLLGLGVIVALLLVYYFGGSLFSSKYPWSKKTETIKTKIVTASTPAIPASMKQTEMVQTTVAENPVASADVDGLKDKISKLTDKINQQQQSLAAMNNLVYQLQAQTTSTNASLQTINATFEQQKAQEKARELAKQKAARAKEKPVQPLNYYVKALVPGRAWLSAGENNNITVRVGDSIPDFGIIQVINVNDGTVITSLGKVLTFDPSDR